MFPFRTQSFIPTYWVCFLEHKIFFTRFTIFFKSYDSKRMGPFHSGWALVWTRIFYSLWTLEALWYIHITQNFMQNWNMALDLHYLVVKASKSIISRKIHQNLSNQQEVIKSQLMMPGIEPGPPEWETDVVASILRSSHVNIFKSNNSDNFCKFWKNVQTLKAHNQFTNQS